MSKIRLVGAACIIAVAAWSAEAGATGYLFDPFEAAGTTIIVGSDGDGQWVGWKNKSTGDCAWNWIGDTSGFNDNYFVGGDAGDDSFNILTSSTTFCDFPLNPPNYNGHWMDLGGAIETGNDTFTSHSTNDTFMYGGGGNDFLISGRASATLAGDEGNDTIFSLGSGSGGSKTGDAHDDCLFIYSSVTPAFTSCGHGTDLWSGPVSLPADCETLDTHCCGVC